MIKKSMAIMGILLILSGCTSTSSSSEEDFTQTTYALGTIISINLYDQEDQELMDLLISRVSEIENRMSAQIESSEVSEINLQAGIAPVAVSDDTYEVVKKALEYAVLSEGKFDPTIGPIVKLWGIGTEEARVPSQEEIDEALKFVDYKRIVLDDGQQTVYLEDQGMSLDLGGIAKGYTADALVEILNDADIDRAMINLGGNIFAYGEKEDGSAYKIAIQTPYDTRNTYFGYVSIKNETVVTSGPYERYFEEDGKIYHHIFDAKTGYPTEGDIVSVSVVAEKSVDADGLSTMLFTMTPEEGLSFIEAMEGVECIYVDKEYKLTVSSGLEGNFTITDDLYSF